MFVRIAAAVAATLLFAAPAVAERLVTYTAFGTGVVRTTNTYTFPNYDRSRPTEFHLSWVVDLDARGYGTAPFGHWEGGPGYYARSIDGVWMSASIAEGTMTVRQTANLIKHYEASTLVVTGLSGSTLPLVFDPAGIGGTVDYAVYGGGGGTFLTGVITGFAITNAASFHQFVLSTVPEPASWAMMTIGIGAAGGAMRAQRRQRRLRPA